MRIFRIITILLIAVATSGNVAAKSIRAIGRVSGQDGDVIPYATLRILHKPIGTLTDSVGVFALSLDGSLLNDTISFSSLGYEE